MMNMTTISKMCSVWCYDIVPEMRYQSELGEYHTYGIQITAPEGTEILHDVSICKETAQRIAARLNHCQVSPIHVYDVIMDMLP